MMREDKKTLFSGLRIRRSGVRISPGAPVHSRGWTTLVQPLFLSVPLRCSLVDTAPRPIPRAGQKNPLPGNPGRGGWDRAEKWAAVKKDWPPAWPRYCSSRSCNIGVIVFGFGSAAGSTGPASSSGRIMSSALAAPRTVFAAVSGT